jgi:hypothetical protein
MPYSSLVITGGQKHTHTPTYQKGEMAIWAHEKIGMGEVNIEVIALSTVLLWNRLFWFNFFSCSGMTPKGQTVQGERVLLKLGI